MIPLPYMPSVSPRSEGFGSKAALLIFDKVLLGIVVLIVVTPLQQRLEALQKRHDRAVEIGDTVVNKALDQLATMTGEVLSYTAQVEERGKGSNVTVDDLVKSRARIDAAISLITAYVPTNAVTTAGKDLSDTVAALNQDVLEHPVAPVTKAQTDPVIQRHRALVTAVV